MLFESSDTFLSNKFIERTLMDLDRTGNKASPIDILRNFLQCYFSVIKHNQLNTIKIYFIKHSIANLRLSNL
jgi:hypothetical protein